MLVLPVGNIWVRIDACRQLAQDLPSRPRRNRRSPTIRSAIQENHLTPSNMILPMFVHDQDKNEPIPSMPGVNRLSYDNGIIDFVSEARSYGVNQVVIFPKVSYQLALPLHVSLVFCTPKRAVTFRWLTIVSECHETIGPKNICTLMRMICAPPLCIEPIWYTLSTCVNTGCNLNEGPEEHQGSCKSENIFSQLSSGSIFAHLSCLPMSCWPPCRSYHLHA